MERCLSSALLRVPLIATAINQPEEEEKRKKEAMLVDTYLEHFRGILIFNRGGVQIANKFTSILAKVNRYYVWNKYS